MENLLHKAALKSDYQSAIDFTKQYTEFNELDDNGLTAMHIAVYIGDIDFVRILLEAGAEPNIFSTEGITPKWVARDFSMTDIENLLTKFGGKSLTNQDFNRAAFSAFNHAIGIPLPEEDSED